MFDIDNYHGPSNAAPVTPEQLEVIRERDRKIAAEKAAFAGLFVHSPAGFRELGLIRGSTRLTVDGKALVVKPSRADWDDWRDETSPAAALREAGYRLHRRQIPSPYKGAAPVSVVMLLAPR